MNWEQIYQEHCKSVFMMLMGMTHNREDAEDLLQETFIKAMRAKTGVRDISKMKSWLMAIARNLCIDSFKKKNTRNKVTVKTDVDTLLEIVPDDGADPEKITMDMDFKSRLDLVLDEMTEVYQTAFNLGVVMKLPYQEIEDITGWSQSMVKSNIFRARKTVASAMQEFRA